MRVFELHSSFRLCKVFEVVLAYKTIQGLKKKNWISRTGESHWHDPLKLLQSTTKTQLKQMESNLGCRYTRLCANFLILTVLECLQLILQLVDINFCCFSSARELKEFVERT